MLGRKPSEGSSSGWAQKIKTGKTDLVLIDPGKTDLDYEHCSELRGSYEWGLKGFDCGIVVDLSQTLYLNSSALGVLLTMNKELPMQGRKLVLVVGDNRVPIDILALTRLEGIFHLASSPEEAVRLYLVPDPAA